MSTLEFRPRFRFQTPLPSDEIVNRVKTHLKEKNPEDIRSRMIDTHLVLRISPETRHFWSPQADVSLETLDEGGTLVRCLFGPVPTVWTMFMFFYALLGFVALIGLMIGFSQWSLDESAWAFWLVPGTLIPAGLLYFAAWEGKRLAHDEMRLLKNFLDEALGCDCFALAEAG